MTGYGRFEGVIEGRQITVEIKSVNHRYFEFSSRITRGYGFLEERLKGYLQERVARGKVDAYVSIETLEDAEAQVQVNHSLSLIHIFLNLVSVFKSKRVDKKYYLPTLFFIL